jgi:hypothetical protein
MAPASAGVQPRLAARDVSCCATAAAAEGQEGVQLMRRDRSCFSREEMKAGSYRAEHSQHAKEQQ